MKKVDPKKYKGLEMSRVAKRILYESPEKFAKCCNGVGSQTGFWNKIVYKLIPDNYYYFKFFGLSFRPCADIHDVEYTYPKVFHTIEDALLWKKLADKRFFKNCRRLIKMRTKWRWLRKIRLEKARLYRWALTNFGKEAFLYGKEILEKEEQYVRR